MLCEACTYRGGIIFSDINTDIRIEQIAYCHNESLLKIVPFLRRQIIPTLCHKIGWESGKCVKDNAGIGVHRTQDNFIATPENFNLVNIKTKLFGEPYCLAITGLKNTSKCHGYSSIV